MEEERFQFKRFTLENKIIYTVFLNPDFQCAHLKNEIYHRFYRNIN